MYVTIFWGFKPCIAKYLSRFDWSKHEIGCWCRHRFIFTEPPVAKPLEQWYIAENLSYQGDPCIREKFSPTENVPKQIAISAVKISVREHYVKQKARLFLRMKKLVSSQASFKSCWGRGDTFFQILVVTSTDQYQQHLNSRVCRNP